MNVSRTVVSKYGQAFRSSGLRLEELEGMADSELSARLAGTGQPGTSDRELMPMTNQKRRKTVLSRLFIIPLLLCFMFPIYYRESTAFKQRLPAFTIPYVWLFTPTMENFRTVLSKASFFRSLPSSTIACFATVSLAVLLGAPAGYSTWPEGGRKARSARRVGS